uniref:Uncharacterized protein n=1 Tax=Arundo donax TaxID=35708 RepID=A0A0A9CBU9_ARUDO
MKHESIDTTFSTLNMHIIQLISQNLASLFFFKKS